LVDENAQLTGFGGEEGVEGVGVVLCGIECGTDAIVQYDLD
jgi:hypothetical protein